MRRGGYYADRFSDAELEDLESLPDEGLESEIALLRVIIRRLLEMIDSQAEAPVLARHLETISRSAGRMATLLRVQRSLGGKSSTQLAFFEALEQVNKELGLNKD